MSGEHKALNSMIGEYESPGEIGTELSRMGFDVLDVELGGVVVAGNSGVYFAPITMDRDSGMAVLHGFKAEE